MQKIKHSDVIEGSIFGATIEELKTMNDLVKSMAANLPKGKSITLVEPTSVENIRKINEEVGKTNKAYEMAKKLRNDNLKLEQRLAEATSQQGKENEKLRQQVNQTNAANRNAAKTTLEQSNAYKVLTRNVNNAQATFKQLAAQYGVNSKQAQSAFTKFDQLDNKLREVNEAARDGRRDVGRYSTGFSAINNSVAQLTREAPAFANSMQTGFMAISNNLPILQDALVGINRENAKLKAEGKPTTSALKQLAGAFLSWNTLISVGITLLTFYGKEVGTFIKSLFDSKEATITMAQTQKTLNEALDEGNKSAVKEASSLDVLYAISQDVSKSLEERKFAVDELQRIYPAYFSNLTDEAILAGNAVKVYNELRTAIFNTANARAIEGKLEERASERLEDRLKLETKIANNRKIITASGISDADQLEAANRVAQGGRNLTGAAILNLRKYEKELEDFNAKALAEDQVLIDAQARLQANGVRGVDTPTTGGTTTGGKTKKQEKDNLDEINKLRAKALEDANALYETSFDTRRRQLTEQYAKEKALLEKYNKDTKDLTLVYNQEFQNIDAEDFAERSKELQAQRDKESLAASEWQIAEWARLDKLKDEQKKIDDEKAKENQANTLKSIQQAQQTLNQAVKDGTERRIRLIDAEINASQRRADLLTQLAANGNKEARESIALEEKNQLKLQQQRERALQKAKRQEVLIAGLKTYSEKVAQGDPNALVNTITDISLLTAALTSLGGFEDGTEFVGKKSGLIDLGTSRDRYVARIDEGERILTRDQNKAIMAVHGNMSNKDMTRMLTTSITPTNLFGITSPNNIEQLTELRAVKELLRANLDKGTRGMDYDPVEKAIIHIERKANATHRQKKHIGGIFGS